MKIISKSPSRISLFGGGTDLNPFASTYGGRVLSMAINLRHETTLTPSKNTYFYVYAMGKERHSDIKFIPKRGEDPKFDLIYEIIRSYDLPSGFYLHDEFEGIQSAGLGSSASAAVAMIGAFNKWLGIEQNKWEIADKAWRMEINLGWVSGKQDQHASTFGGVNMFEFDKQVWREKIDTDKADEFVKWCLLVYTGKDRHSSDIQQRLKENMSQDKTIKALREIKTLTWHAKEALEDGNFKKVGILLDEEWKWKKVSNPLSTNLRLDTLYDVAVNCGALGGKVLGAGGEGHFLFIVEPAKRRKLWETISNYKDMPLQQIDFSIDRNGLEVRSL